VKKKYFIKQYTQQEYLHGGVGVADAEKILLSLGFKPVAFPRHFSFSFKARISRLFFLLKMIFFIKRGSVVAFLFPVYARINRLLLWFLHMKGVKLVCIIADIEGLRDADEMLLKKETRQLKSQRYFIVHNNRMKSFILQLVPGSVCSVLNFFDFLAEPVQTKRTNGYWIVFAGNLEKSKFLSSLDKMADPGLHFNLYGPGPDEKLLLYKNVSYYGIHKPYDMPSVVQGSFGLIWDGESIDSCTGGYGEYLRYNSQHKLSLYILSGLPVIIWDKAATAELVKQYKIGITIKHLNEMADKINALTDDEYQQMQNNMQPLADRISKGECLGNAIDELMKLI
jgi:glycosyltransferase involved in cell wall biosynthesis